MDKWIPSGPALVKGAMVAAIGGVVAGLVLRWMDNRRGY